MLPSFEISSPLLLLFLVRLIVVKQQSLDDSFIMLKLTATHERFEKEAIRIGLRMPLKIVRTADNTPWYKKLLGDKKGPVEVCYAKYEPELKDQFDSE